MAVAFQYNINVQFMIRRYVGVYETFQEPNFVLDYKRRTIEFCALRRFLHQMRKPI